MTKTRNNRPKKRLYEIYNLLYKMYGPRNWWPADSDFEVAVGAILTQNTNWQNVERAILNLKAKKLLSPLKLHKLNIKRLARLIRSCGYYNIKAKRLKSFLDFLVSGYGGKIENMRTMPLPALREELLDVNGIGPETADSILLYAIKKPIFVVDAYTKRILTCLRLSTLDSDYSEVQKLFMDNLPMRVKLYNEFHALIVEHGKSFCKKNPKCDICALRPIKGAR